MNAAPLTEGSIVRPLLRLAIPFAVGNLLNLTTLVVDRLWVGRVGTEALAALGTANAALMVFMTVSMGMSVGTLAGVARATGSRDAHRAGSFFQQGMLLAWALGLVFFLASWFAPAGIIGFVAPGGDLHGPATDYLQISMGGLLVYAPLQTLTFALQGAGEARVAMRLSAIAPIINALLDPLFIFGFDLGVAGAAWATVTATAIALAVAWRAVTAPGRAILATGTLRLDGAILRRIAFIGFPGTLEHLVRNVASFALVKLIAGFGAAVLSAYTTAMVLLMMLIFPGLAIGQATSSLVGQNLGAGQAGRAWRTAWSATALYATFMVVVGGLIYLFAGPLVALFDPNPIVVAEGRRLLHIVVLCFPLLAVAFVLSRAFAGAGNTLPAMAVAAVAHLAWQLPMVHYLGLAYGPVGAWWSMSSAFMVHGLLAAGVYIARHRPRARKSIR
ncbi:MAG: MATE family efflux transporter [Myxococcales bacterium]|nr:MATE family efflux transporter [Myxococcales bacterium]